jgi:hypothetical protein
MNHTPILRLHPLNLRWIVGLCLVFLPHFGQADPRYYPESPLLLFPPQNTTIQVESVTTALELTWEAVVEADEYLVNITVNQIPLMPQIVATPSATIQLQLDESKLPARVDWAVLSRKGGVNSRTPSIGMFYIQLRDNSPTPTPTPTFTPTPTPVLLDAPKLLVPTDDSNLTPHEVLGGLNFQWQTITGAAAYRITVYDENDPLTHTVEGGKTTYPMSNLITFPSIKKVYQWVVQALAQDGTPGKVSPRSDFSIGAGLLPTPTPLPITSDISGDQQRTVLDLFLYSLTYRTNAPHVDYNQSGINDQSDLLIFMKDYLETR